MITLSKKEILVDLKTASLQIESLEAQLAHTFGLEKKDELKKELKNKWQQIDVLLDKYNQAKKYLKGPLTND